MNGRDLMLAAWDRFPGRSCNEQQWESWVGTMLSAIEAARKEAARTDAGVSARAVEDAAKAGFNTLYRGD